MKTKIEIKQSVIIVFILSTFFLIAVLLICSIVFMRESIRREQAAEERRTEFKQLGIDLADASDYLTDEARKYAITTDIAHLNRYWEEINNTQTRDKVILKLKELESPEKELKLLAGAKQRSDALVETERRSMRLVLEYLGVQEKDMAPEIAGFRLNAEDQKLGRSEKLAKAREIMFDSKYDADKKEILEPIEIFQETMNSRLESELKTARIATSRAAAMQIVLALIIIFAIALLIRTLFKYVTYPINSYTKALNNFTSTDDNFSLVPVGTLELQNLADTFNKLYFSFQEELLKRRQAEQTMRRAKEEAEQANNAKTEFLASMSHEIRTPLNTIIGYQYLMMDTRLDSRQKKYCEKTGIVADNLLGLINGILDLSKIEAGKMQLESTQFDIVSAVRGICDVAEAETSNKGLDLKLDVNSNIPRMLYGDVTRLKQVVSNLLSNAIKFTEKGQIYVSLDFDMKNDNIVNVLIKVRDTGIGISKSQAKVIFERFTQGDASTTRKYGGTGLGLAICRKIAELMNGSISVKSSLGKGACFYFRAEFEIAQDIVAPVSNNEKTPVNMVFCNRKVLLVEDNRINLEMTEEILKLIGFEVLTAENGKAAVELVGKNTFDVILMDIRMPEMDGYEATKRIRKMESGKDVPIVALTADAVDGVSEKAKRAGMNAYLTKPLYPEKLSELIKKLLMDKRDSFCVSGNDISEHTTKEGYGMFDKGISRLGGNRPKYARLLNQFLEDHRNDGDIILSLYGERRFDDLKNVIHKLKGVSGSMGVEGLYTLCNELEQSISNNIHNDLILLQIEKINSSLQNICGMAANFLQEKESFSLDKIPEDAAESIDNVMSGLYSYVSFADSDAKEYFWEHRNFIKKNIDEDLYGKIYESIMHFDFEQAEIYLENLINEIGVRRELL